MVMAELWGRMCIAGPKERTPLDESSLTKFLDAESYVVYFRAEPSRFFIKQSVTSPNMPTDLVQFLLDMLDSKQRPPLVAALEKFGRHLKATAQHGVTREQDWSPIIEYGVNLKLIADASNAAKEATACQQDVGYRSESTSASVDWLAASLFLLFDCQEKITSDMLRKVAWLPYAESVWPYWAGSSKFSQSLCASVWPMVEKLLLRQELLGVRFACESSSVSLLSLLLLWSNQVYLNVLDWPEVCNYVTLSIIGGPRLQALFFVAILFHLKEDIISRRSVGDLTMYFSSPKLDDFKLH
uniref:BROMI C-terminal Rab TBC-like domain-containing protein n=1 Tax=Plectus sambesii TaxID=2011161 RepID=A0A914V420_9BILA